MDKDWVKVYVSQDLTRSQMLSSYLKSNDIESVILNKRDSFLHIGDVELYVKNINVIKAKHFIQIFTDV